MRVLPTRTFLAALSASLLVPAAACTDYLPPKTQIEGLRVLAIQADPPHAFLLEDVELSALVVNPLSDEPIELEWYACLIVETGGFFAAGEDGEGESCTDPDAPGRLELGTGPTATLFIDPSLLGSLFSGNTEDQPEELTAVPLEPRELAYLFYFRGWHVRVTVVATAGEQRVEAYKRVVVKITPELIKAFVEAYDEELAEQLFTELSAFETPRNLNPAPPMVLMTEADPDVILPEVSDPPPAGDCLTLLARSTCERDEDCPEGLCSDGVCEQGPNLAATAIRGGKRWRFTAQNQPTEQQKYNVLDFTAQVQEREEIYFYSWFTTGDWLQSAVTKSTRPENDMRLGGDVSEDALLEEPDGTKVLPIWIVARDGRGGTSWCHSRIPWVYKDEPCGNGELDDGEACDDGNTVDGDGCSIACEEEGSPSP